MSPKIGLKTSSEDHSEYNRIEKTVFEYSDIHHLSFPGLLSALQDLSSAFGKRINILLDEWSDLPLELQPYLADILRKIVLPASGYTVKIAAIEYRSNFRVVNNISKIGFELGADIAADIDLDDTLVFQNDALKSRQFFKELFFNHVKNEENRDLNLNINNSDEFIQRCFTQTNTFDELVRSAEGVPRDAIQIAIIAAQNANDDAISIPHIRKSAQKWFQKDKEQAIQSDETLSKLLPWIVDNVIRGRKAKAFLLEQSENKNEYISQLYDSRVIHIIKKGISSTAAPGVRYNVYSIDYGCYVDLISTINEPDKLFEVEDQFGNVSSVDVPVDDYLSIRRAILDLDEFTKSQSSKPSIT